MSGHGRSVCLIVSLTAFLLPFCACQVCPPTKVELFCGSGSEFVENNGMLSWHQCVPKSCGEPPAISNGYTVPERGPIAKGGHVRIYCNEGYQLTGGDWSPVCNDNCTFTNHSTCTRIVCSNQNVTNGVVEPSQADVEYGRSVKVACNYGYMKNDSAHLSGDNLERPAEVMFFRICSNNSMLTNLDVSCIPIRCPEVVAAKYLTCTNASMCKGAVGIKTAVASPARMMNVDESVMLNCLPGFHWSGGSNALQCRWTGAFTTVSGMCVPSLCNSTIPSNLLSWEKESTVTDGGIYYKGSDYIVCNYGYIIEHPQLPSNSTCPTKMLVNCSSAVANKDPSLNLNPKDFSCVRASCPMVNLISGLQHYNSTLLNLHMTLSIGETVNVTCVEGYRAAPLDATSASCENSYSFAASCGRGESTKDPRYSPCEFNRLQCVPVHCTIPAIPHGSISLLGADTYDMSRLQMYNVQANMSWNLSSNMTANLSCDVGYRPASSLVDYPASSPRTIVLSCSSECQLNYSSPSCKLVSCKDVLPAGHFVSGRLPRPFLHGDVYEVYCPSGSVVDGTTSCETMYQTTCYDGSLMFKMPTDLTFRAQQIQCKPSTCGNGCSQPCSFDQRFQDPLAETIPNTTVSEGLISRFFQCRSASAQPVDNECKQFVDIKCAQGCFTRLSNCNLVQQNCQIQLPPHSFTVPAVTSLTLNNRDSRTIYCEAGYMLEDDTPSICETVQVATCSCGSAPIKRCIPKTCASKCDLGCPASQLLQFPYFSSARYLLGPEISLSSTIAHLGQLQLSCMKGYVPISNLSFPRPVCNPTSMISAVCRSCEINVTDGLMCGLASCPAALFPYQTSDGLQLVDSASRVGFQQAAATLTGERINITCPVNYAVAGQSARTKEVMCAAKSDGTCGIELPACDRISCPAFRVPVNSMATWYNDSVSPPLKEVVSGGSSLALLAGQSADIECNSSYRLSSSSITECAYKFSVKCQEDGTLMSSRTNSSSIDACELQPCTVVCDFGYAYASSDDSKLCTNEVCAFNAPRSQTMPCSNISQLGAALSKPLSGDHCQYLSLNVFPCVPFRCVRFEMPANSVSAETVQEVGGQMVTIAATSSTVSGQVDQRYGATINVSCKEGFMPELFAGAEGGCPQSWYITRCDGAGLWENYQRCVPKTCRVTWQLGGYWQYADVSLGSTFQIPCGANDEVPLTLRSSVCLDSCNMSKQQVCSPKTCRQYNVSGFLLVSSSNQSVTVGESITVRCPPGLVAAHGFIQRCSKTFVSLCQPDQTFDRQDLLQCVDASCPPYVEVDNNVERQVNALRPALFGQPCQDFRCKAGYGLGGNASLTSFTRRCGREDETTSACEWEAGQMCEPVVCGKFTADMIPMNSTVVYDANMSYSFGQKVNGQCELGFHVPSQMTLRNFEIYCQADGTFQLPPSCLPVMCPPFERYLRENFAPNVWSKAPVTQSNTEVKFNETVQLLCPEGFEFDTSTAGGEQATCQVDGSYTSFRLCVPVQCSQIEFDTLQGVKLSDYVANPTTRSYGDKIVIECQDGFQLTSEKPPAVVEMVLPGLEAFGAVRVLSRKRFPLPPLTQASAVSLDGSYSAVKIDFPANSWPASVAQGPEILVFNSSQELPYRPATAQLAGTVFEFGPSGIKFQNPVKLSIPTFFSSKPQDLELFVYRFLPAEGRWEALQRADFKLVGGQLVVETETSSFSAYAPMTTRPTTTSPSIVVPTNATVVSPKSKFWTNGKIGGIVAGAFVFVLLVGLVLTRLFASKEKSSSSSSEEKTRLTLSSDSPAPAPPAPQSDRQYRPILISNRQGRVDVPVPSTLPSEDETSGGWARLPPPAEETEEPEAVTRVEAKEGRGMADLTPPPLAQAQVGRSEAIDGGAWSSSRLNGGNGRRQEAEGSWKDSSGLTQRREQRGGEGIVAGLSLPPKPQKSE